MNKRMLALLKSEAVLYILVGVMTTAVNYIIFALADRGLSGKGIPESVSYKIAYGLAFFGAVLFAYWSNKFWVFRNHNMRPGYLLQEFAGFFLARVVSGFITFLIMVVMVDLMHFSHTLGWLASTVFNLVFNYLASKFWIFRDKDRTADADKG